MSDARRTALTATGIQYFSKKRVKFGRDMVPAILLANFGKSLFRKLLAKSWLFEQPFKGAGQRRRIGRFNE